MGEAKCTEADGRLRDEFRRDWHSRCDCDWSLMSGNVETFDDRMEAAGFIRLVPVTRRALEQPFAAELGIEKGGTMWELTAKGRKVLEPSP